MKRVLVGICLSLIIILLDGYDQLYAYAPTAGIFEVIQNYHGPHLRIGIPASERGTHKIEAIEESDDQFNSFKKYLQSRCQFAALYLAKAIKDLLHETVQGPMFPEPSPHPLFQRSTAALQVFRI